MRFTPTRAVTMLIVALATALMPLVLAKVPRPLADITMPTPDGKKIRFAQYQGKTIAILLFSTTCSDCLKSIDLLGKAQKQFGAKGFQAFAAAVNVDAPDQIKAFVDRYRPPFPTGHLGQQELLKITDLGPTERPYVPIFIFVNHHGVVRYQYFGKDPIMDQQEKATMAVIDSMVKNPE